MTPRLSPPLPAIDAYWASVLGGSPADFYSGGVHLACRFETDGFMAVKRQSVLASYHPSIGTNVAQRLANCLAQEPAAAALPSVPRSLGLSGVYGPAALCYLTRAPAELPLPPGTRRLHTQDQPALDRFLQHLGEPREYRADLQESTRWMFGTFDGASLLGVSAVIVWADVIGEVFIDLLPQVRGRGWGTALAAAAARWAIDQAGLIAQYDTLWTNNASLAVARRLGFAPYAELFMAKRA